MLSVEFFYKNKKNRSKFNFLERFLESEPLLFFDGIHFDIKD